MHELQNIYTCACMHTYTCTHIQVYINSRLELHWEKQKELLTTAGDQDVIIIASASEAVARITDVVPRSPHELTEEDKGRMVDQGLSPEECTDDINILQARLRLDGKMKVVEMLASDNRRELSRVQILERLQSHFQEVDDDGSKLIEHV